MGEFGQWRTTDDMRRDQNHLRTQAREIRESLDAAPAAFDASTIGRADTASMVNDVIGAVFKQTAAKAAELDAIADKIDPDTGTFDGHPVNLGL